MSYDCLTITFFFFGLSLFSIALISDASLSSDWNASGQVPSYGDIKFN